MVCLSVPLHQWDRPRSGMVEARGDAWARHLVPLCPACSAAVALTEEAADAAVARAGGLLEKWACPVGVGWHLGVRRPV